MFKILVQTVKQEWRNPFSRTPGLVKGDRTETRKREKTGSTKCKQSRKDTGRTMKTESGASSREIWQETGNKEKTRTEVLSEEQCSLKGWKQEVKSIREGKRAI